MVGFSVMRSPVGVSPRLAEGSQDRRLWIDLSEATRCSAPGSKTQGELLTGLALLRPSTLTKKQGIQMQPTQEHSDPQDLPEDGYETDAAGTFKG